MHILNLKLENVKGHAASEFDFTDGINAIVGQNGVGKSTLLEAIGCALFGALAYNQRDFIREGEKTAAITVTVQSGFDDRRYEVVRRMGGSNQYYVYDPELDARICEGTTDVQAFLREHMKVEPNTDLQTLFNDAVGVPQGTLTAAFALSPTKRRPTFDKLLQVEEYDQAYKKLADPLKRLKERIAEFDLKVMELATRLERLPQLQKSSAARQKEIAKAEKQQKKIDEQLQKTLTKRQKLDTIQQEVASAKTESARLQQQMESLQTQQATAEQTLAESEQAAELVKQNQAGHECYVAAQTEQRSLGAKQEARQKLEATCSQIERSIAQVQSRQELLAQQIEEAAAAAAVVQTLGPKVEKQTALEQKRNELQRQSIQLADAERTVATQQEQQRAAEAQKQSLEAQINAANTHREARTQAAADLTTMRQTLSESQQQRVQYEAEAKTIKEQTTLLEDAKTSDCPICEQALTATHRTKMFERNEKKLGGLRTSYKEKQQAESKAQKSIEELELQIQTLDAQLQRVPRPEEVERLAQQLAAAVASIQQRNEQIATLRAANATLAETEAELKQLGDPRQDAAVAQQKAAKKTQFEQEKAQTAKTLTAAQKELTTHQKELAQLASLDDKRAALMRTMQEHESAYQAVLANQNAANQLADRQAALKALQTQQKENAKQQKATAKTQEKLEKKFDAQAYDELVAAEQTQRAQKSTIGAQRSSLQAEEARDQAEIDSLLAYQTELETIEQKRAKVETEQAVLDMIRKLLREAGPHITQALIHQVSNGAEQIFGDLMQDYSRRLVWNDDYGISLEIDGRKRQFVQLSGGEQMSAALSVRLALLREMSSIDVAFFDEPTTNLDEMRRESLAKQIVEVKGFRQLFVISHDDTFEQSTENIIRVERSE